LLVLTTLTNATAESVLTESLGSYLLNVTPADKWIIDVTCLRAAETY